MKEKLAVLSHKKLVLAWISETEPYYVVRKAAGSSSIKDVDTSCHVNTRPDYISLN